MRRWTVLTVETASLRHRLLRLFLGLGLCGSGLALMVLGDLGLGPWDVLHQGLSRRTGVPIGTMVVLAGVPVLACWVPLRQRPGIGTLLNVLTVGVVIDVVLAVLSPPHSLGIRLACMLTGVLLVGIGSGFYIGAGLGPGPRDGLMTGLAARGIGTVGTVRTVIELAVLVAGWLLGGTIGIGTLLFAFGIGPLVQLFLGRLSLPVLTAPAE